MTEGLSWGLNRRGASGPYHSSAPFCFGLRVVRLNLTLPRLVSVLLLALLGGIVAFWAVTLTAPKVAIAPATGSAPTASFRDFSGIAPLFGALSAQAAASPVNGLKVHGLVTGPDAGLVLIAAEGKPARPYSVGDTVAPGLTLGEIGPESITLIRQASGERLTLPTPARASTAVLTAGPAAASTSPSTPTSLPQSPATSPAPSLPALPAAAVAPAPAPAPAPVPAPEPPGPQVAGAPPSNSTAPGPGVPTSVAPGYILPGLPRVTR